MRLLWAVPIALISTVALILAAVLAGVILYVLPHTDLPAKTDVVFVIGPPTPSRLRIAEKLLGDGWSDNLMVSLPRSGDAELSAFCGEAHPYRIYCSVPNPFTTQGEAEWLGKLATERGWKSATIITTTPHVTRARIIVGRCFSGDVVMIPDETSLTQKEWIRQFVYQTGAFVKAVLTPQC